MYYDYAEELDRVAKELKRLEKDTKPVKNWQSQSYGSTMCYSITMQEVYDVYKESRQYDNW